MKITTRTSGCTTLLLILVALPALAQEMPADAPKWGPHIDLEGKAGTDRHLGEADLFIPLAQDATTMLFADLRGRFDDAGSTEGNFGLGVRHMLAGGWNLGAYGYVDRRISEHGNAFMQATLGAELLTTDWDFRLNGYLPFGQRAYRFGETAGSESMALSGTAVTVTSGGGGYLEERSMAGFDGEIGWRLPMFDPDSGVNLRAYAGGYYFSAEGVDDVIGPRLRTEVVFDEMPFLWQGSRVSLGGEWQHDDPRGHQGFVSLRLRVPLQIYGKPASQLSFQERRMLDPIQRDIDIVSNTRRVATPIITETATHTAGGQALVMLDSATTAGADLPNALVAAGANSTVILSGTFNTSSVIVQPGQTLMGAGDITVQTPSGRTLTVTTPGAAIFGSVAVDTGGTLSGMTITSTGETAVGASGNTTIVNNTITAIGPGNPFILGLGVYVSNAIVTNNTITVTNASAGWTFGMMVGGASNVLVADNTIFISGVDNNPDTVGAFAFGAGGIAAGSTGNDVIITGGTGAGTGNACILLSGGNSGSIGYSVGGVAGSCP